MKDQYRNLHPIKEAVFAMYHWGKEYVNQNGGCMDFYDKLSRDGKDFCKRAIIDIFKANP